MPGPKAPHPAPISFKKKKLGKAPPCPHAVTRREAQHRRRRELTFGRLFLWQAGVELHASLKYSSFCVLCSCFLLLLLLPTLPSPSHCLSQHAPQQHNFLPTTPPLPALLLPGLYLLLLPSSSNFLPHSLPRLPASPSHSILPSSVCLLLIYFSGWTFSAFPAYYSLLFCTPAPCATAAAPFYIALPCLPTSTSGFWFSSVHMHTLPPQACLHMPPTKDSFFPSPSCSLFFYHLHFPNTPPQPALIL